MAPVRRADDGSVRFVSIGAGFRVIVCTACARRALPRQPDFTGAESLQFLRRLNHACLPTKPTCSKLPPGWLAAKALDVVPWLLFVPDLEPSNPPNAQGGVRASAGKAQEDQPCGNPSWLNLAMTETANSYTAPF